MVISINKRDYDHPSNAYYRDKNSFSLSLSHTLSPIWRSRGHKMPHTTTNNGMELNPYQVQIHIFIVIYIILYVYIILDIVYQISYRAHIGLINCDDLLISSERNENWFRIPTNGWNRRSRSKMEPFHPNFSYVRLDSTTIEENRK